MADDCVLPTMSGISNFLSQDLAFLETIPSVPITIGITVTLDALWILLISSAISWCLSTFSSSILMMFWSAGTAMSISVHSCVSFRTRVISGRYVIQLLVCVNSHVPGDANVSILYDCQRLMVVLFIGTFYMYPILSNNSGGVGAVVKISAS